MYHHRYQPPPHLANKNSSAFNGNNFLSTSSSSTEATQAITTNNLSSQAIHHNNNNTIADPDPVHNNHGQGSSFPSGISNKFIEERQDVIFRRVRGILNKITPETFDKLSKELVNVGLDSPRTLRGVIYLLFDKALKDLKYSSLYAKLCQELSEKAPNFETEPGPNTFCKFLISKCEDEFERRRKATEDFDGKNELTDEEYELKAIAKQKMLGNIKFICELGKKRLLQEEILHECIRGLLSKKKERPIQDQAQDLECLCQIMRTIGSLLDFQASRNLMNQYFERIDMYSKKPELPSRIRFMLRDVIDLRNNNWRPRPFQREDNVPQPISKLREEARYDGSQNISIDKMGNTKNLIGIGEISRMHSSKLSSLLLDDEPSFTTTTDFHWGTTFLPHDSAFDAFASGLPSTGNAKQPAKPPAISVNSTVSSQIIGKQNVKQVVNHVVGPQQPDFPRDLLNKQPHRNNDYVGKHRNFGNDPRRPSDTGRVTQDPKSAPPTFNPLDSKFSARNGRDNFMGPHIFPDGTAPSSANHLKMQPFREDHPPSSLRKNFSDGPRLIFPLSNRNDNIVPNPRQSEFRRSQQHDLLPINQPSPINNHSHPPPPNLSDRNYRSELRDQRNVHVRLQENSDHKERKLPREGGESITEPKPRFPASNQRGPAFKDRPQTMRDRQPRHFDGANHQTHSEVDMDWRASTHRTSPPSTQVVQVAASSSLIEQHANLIPCAPVVPPSANSLIKQNAEGSKNLQSDCKIESKSSPVDPIRRENSNSERKPFGERAFTERSFTSTQGGNLSRGDRENKGFNNYVPAGSRNRDNVVSHQNPTSNSSSPPPRFSDPRPQQSPLNASPRLIQRRINQGDQRPPSSSQGNSGFKSDSRPNNLNGRENLDKRDRENYGRRTNAKDSIQKPQNKHFDSVLNSENRSQMSRNQSFETTHSLDSTRNTSRHRDGHGNNTYSKEHPLSNLSAINTPLLSQSLTKTTAANFSLRPSHHLMGRLQPSVTLSTPKMVGPAPESNKTELRDDAKEEFNATKHSISEQSKVSDAPSSQSVVSANSVASTQINQTSKVAPKSPQVDQFIIIIFETSNEQKNINTVSSKVKELKIPKSEHEKYLLCAIKKSLSSTGALREYTSKLLVHLIPSAFEASSLLGAFTSLFEQLQSLEVETPKVKSLVAGLLSQAVYDGLLTLEEVADVLVGGKHHPLFLLFLQKLEKSAGQSWLIEKFSASKINLMEMLPDVDRSKERLASVLKDRCLGFLDPMLTIEPDLWMQMRDCDASPAAVYRWVKDNVDQSIQNSPTFAHVFTLCLLKYIHNTSLEGSKNYNNNNEQQSQQEVDGETQSNKSSPIAPSSPTSNDIEKKILAKYQQVLQAILRDKQMQLASLYTLQSFYHGLDFPKGALLRWFHMLYDLNIVDEDVFSMWREEINDVFPGKGQALFQVNTWLNWLAEAESEEDEEA